MAWNQPNINKAAKPTSRKINLARYVFPVFFILAVLVVTWIFLPSAKKDFVKDSKKPRMTDDVAKNIQKMPIPKASSGKRKELPPQRVGEVRDGKRLLCDGRLQIVTPNVITVGVDRTTLVGRLFEHPADQILASTLLANPGDGLLGDSESAYPNFQKLFLQSLEHEIEDLDTDSESDKDIKSAVREFRKELVELMKAGEDLEQVMIDNRNQLKELATYYDDIEKMVKDAAKDGSLTEKDHQDLIAAANMMLEERGCKPLELSSGLLFRIQRAAEKAYQQQGE